MSLLTDLDVLRRRTRADRHAYAFPLFLFGGLILLAPVCYLSFAPPPVFELVKIDQGPFPQFTPIGLLVHPALVGWYWVMTIIGGLWLTGRWYRQQARRRGVETDTRLANAVAGAALLGFLLWPTLFSVAATGAYSRSAVNLAILLGGTALAAAAGLWSRRHTGWTRSTGMAAAAFLATVAFGALGAYLTHGHAALVIIAAALLVLAWAERSVLLTVVGVRFAGAAVLANLYNMENVLGWGDGWDERVTALQNLLLPGAILLAGGVAAVIGNRR